MKSDKEDTLIKGIQINKEKTMRGNFDDNKFNPIIKPTEESNPHN